MRNGQRIVIKIADNEVNRKRGVWQYWRQIGRSNKFRLEAAVLSKTGHGYPGQGDADVTGRVNLVIEITDCGELHPG